MLQMEIIQMAIAVNSDCDSLPSANSPHLKAQESVAADFLIETFAKLEIHVTQSQQKTSHFSNRNKNGLRRSCGLLARARNSDADREQGRAAVNLPWKPLC
jgi:hypothetical protein